MLSDGEHTAINAILMVNESRVVSSVFLHSVDDASANSKHSLYVVQWRELRATRTLPTKN
jgi:hypothetical protein